MSGKLVRAIDGESITIETRQQYLICNGQILNPNGQSVRIEVVPVQQGEFHDNASEVLYRNDNNNNNRQSISNSNRHPSFIDVPDCTVISSDDDYSLGPASQMLRNAVHKSQMASDLTVSVGSGNQRTVVASSSDDFNYNYDDKVRIADQEYAMNYNIRKVNKRRQLRNDMVYLRQQLNRSKASTSTSQYKVDYYNRAHYHNQMKGHGKDRLLKAARSLSRKDSHKQTNQPLSDIDRRIAQINKLHSHKKPNNADGYRFEVLPQSIVQPTLAWQVEKAAFFNDNKSEYSLKNNHPLVSFNKGVKIEAMRYLMDASAWKINILKLEHTKWPISPIFYQEEKYPQFVDPFLRGIAQYFKPASACLQVHAYTLRQKEAEQYFSECQHYFKQKATGHWLKVSPRYDDIKVNYAILEQHQAAHSGHAKGYFMRNVINVPACAIASLIVYLSTRWPASDRRPDIVIAKEQGWSNQVFNKQQRKDLLFLKSFARLQQFVQESYLLIAAKIGDKLPLPKFADLEYNEARWLCLEIWMTGILYWSQAHECRRIIKMAFDKANIDYDTYVPCFDVPTTPRDLVAVGPALRPYAPETCFNYYVRNDGEMYGDELGDGSTVRCNNDDMDVSEVEEIEIHAPE